MRLLLAEDDLGLREVLARGLRENGYVVDEVAAGDDALHMLQVNDYAIALLDWRMPGMAGVDVIASMRRQSIPVAVLMLTARDSASDRVTGLDAGADDYLVKPFEFPELLARLRALQRRPRGVDAPRLEVGRLVLDPATRVASIGGADVNLTRTEFSIVELLMRRAPRVVSRDSIVNQAWADEGDRLGSNTIEVHIARIRRKLRGSGVEIRALRGVGYRLVPE